MAWIREKFWGDNDLFEWWLVGKYPVVRSACVLEFTNICWGNRHITEERLLTQISKWFPEISTRQISKLRIILLAYPWILLEFCVTGSQEWVEQNYWNRSVCELSGIPWFEKHWRRDSPLSGSFWNESLAGERYKLRLGRSPSHKLISQPYDSHAFGYFFKDELYQIRPNAVISITYGAYK